MLTEMMQKEEEEVREQEEEEETVQKVREEEREKEARAQVERREERGVEAQEGHGKEEEMNALKTRKKGVQCTKEMMCRIDTDMVEKRMVDPCGQRTTPADGARASTNLASSQKGSRTGSRR